MCKAELDVIIYTSDTTRSFEAFDQSKLGGHTQSKALCAEKSTLALVKSFFDIVCPKCKPRRVLRSKKELSSHLTREHDLYLCGVCLRDRPVFLSEQVCMSKADLTVHMLKGDSQTHMKGHPKCRFCNEHYYGDDQLYAHMKEKKLAYGSY